MCSGWAYLHFLWFINTKSPSDPLLCRDSCRCRANVRRRSWLIGIDRAFPKGHWIQTRRVSSLLKEIRGWGLTQCVKEKPLMEAIWGTCKMRHVSLYWYWRSETCHGTPLSWQLNTTWPSSRELLSAWNWAIINSTLCTADERYICPFARNGGVKGPNTLLS